MKENVDWKNEDETMGTIEEEENPIKETEE